MRACVRACVCVCVCERERERERERESEHQMQNNVIKTSAHTRGKRT